MHDYKITIKDKQDGRQYQNWIKAENEKQAIDFALELATDQLDTDLTGVEVLTVELI